MRFIRELSRETKDLLYRIQKQSKYPQVRQRALCLIMSSQGVTITELMSLFRVSRKTIYNWFIAWEKNQLVGLYNQPGRGRKPKLKEEQENQVKEWVKEQPKSLDKVVDKIANNWGIKVSKETVKRIIKKKEMTWKSVRRRVRGKPQEWELEVKIPALKELKKRAEKGEIDLRYLDEKGISLQPSVPYAWQDKKEPIFLKSSISKRINIIGIMNKENELYTEIYEGSITSNLIIKCLDKFSDNLTKKTVIVMDQSSIHTSNEILSKRQEWSQKNLELFWLPPYSPHLNLIEILWRFLKYEWIEVSAYDSWINLHNYINKVFDAFGKEYVINFV